MNFKNETEKVIKLREQIYKQIPNNIEMQDIIWNYAQTFLSILRLWLDRKYFDDAIINLEKYKKWEIKIEELIKHKKNITSIVEEKLNI